MKPIILGMNNPKSSDPLKVLLPTDEPGSAGNRLWNMTEMTETQYLLAFDRRNLLSSRTWRNRAAIVAAQKFMEELPERSEVVVLGRLVWFAFDFEIVPPCERRITANGSKFYFVPHPSGKNLWYNDEDNGKRVGRLLRSLSEK